MRTKRTEMEQEQMANSIARVYLVYVQDTQYIVFIHFASATRVLSNQNASRQTHTT